MIEKSKKNFFYSIKILNCSALRLQFDILKQPVYYTHTL